MIYFDHNATTPLKPVVRQAILSVLDLPTNASSVHKSGRAARMKIESARMQVAKAIQTEPAGIIFTSGATEANNMALNLPLVSRVLVSSIEHPSVLKARDNSELIPVNSDGIVDMDVLEDMLKADNQPTLVSVMMVNNETGIIQPIKEIAKLVRKYNGFTHTDAVQAMGRIPIDMVDLGVDMLSLSSHKIGGPQGMGALAFRNCVEPAVLLKGGGQEKNRRSGTENTAGIVGFATACTDAIENMDSYNGLSELRDKLETALSGHVTCIAHSNRVSNTSMMIVSDIASETLLIALDLEGIAISNGSACSSGTVEPSHVLSAMSIPDIEANCAIRISLGWNTTEDEVDSFIESFLKIVSRIKARA